MTLGGLAIAIGVVVDDAVIDVENIVRRLRENRRLIEPRPLPQVVLDATLEVRGAVVYATFAVILVVLPVMTLSGTVGRLFAPLGLAYVTAVMASLVVALTVTPALSMALLPGRIPERDPPVIRWMRGGYQALLQRLAKWPRTLIAIAAGLTIAGCAALPFFGRGLIPELKEGHFVIHMAAVPGTSLEESLRVGARFADALLRLPEVRSVAQRAGRAEESEDTWGPHYSEIEVDLKPGLSGDDAEKAEADIRRTLAGFVGVSASVMTFLTERIEETLSGYTAAVVVNIFGNDLDLLDRKAQEVAQVLNEIPGATDVQVQSPPGLPQLTIRLRNPDLERWGFDSVEVLELIRTAYQGDVVGQTYEGAQVFDIMTILDAASRDNITKVGDLPLRSPSGVYVTLRQIADIYQSSARYQVLHEGARRVQAVTANVIGTDVVSFVRGAKAMLGTKVHLPSGTYVQFAGAAEAQSRSQRDLIINSLTAAIGIILLLSVVTRNWRNLLLVLANLPFALVGGVLAVFATGAVLALGSMVGFITLFGISLRNSILMIAHYEHLVEVEGRQWGLEAAIAGAADRLTPILMTSIVTGLGILPLAIGMDEPGREIQGPMAIVILGGLVTSMALNLIVLPTLALRYGRFERKPEGLARSILLRESKPAE
jgi:Cu/Ag efflux pump CusA